MPSERSQTQGNLILEIETLRLAASSLKANRWFNSLDMAILSQAKTTLLEGAEARRELP